MLQDFYCLELRWWRNKADLVFIFQMVLKGGRSPVGRQLEAMLLYIPVLSEMIPFSTFWTNTKSGVNCNESVEGTGGEPFEGEWSNWNITIERKIASSKNNKKLQTCATGFVLGAVSMQQQREDQDQDQDEPHQSHDQQEPPLLIERTLRQGCGNTDRHSTSKRCQLLCCFVPSSCCCLSHSTRPSPPTL